ncbi:MAG: hypothetical protein KDJ44_02375 [Rhodoblastus sp.]|nr:hypothetical protein [Rhodoblastus sp.]
MEAPKLFDPRDPDQREDDPSTWKPSNNPALILRDIGRLMGGVADGFDEWVKRQADYCEQMVTSPPADDRASADPADRSAQPSHDRQG